MDVGQYTMNGLDSEAFQIVSSYHIMNWDFATQVHGPLKLWMCNANDTSDSLNLNLYFILNRMLAF